MDLFGLMAVLQTLESCKIWLRDQGLLADPAELWCDQCRGHTWSEIRRGGGRKDETKFRCGPCRRERSIRLGSFFSKSKLSLQVLVALIFMFAYRFPIHLVETMLKQSVSQHAIIDWFGFLREICSQWLLDNPTQFGGVGCIVEIDECMLKGKRKYNRGRMVAPGQWVFGAWDRRTGRGMVWLVPNRRRETLLPLIKRHIRPGTIIYSDGAPMYHSLEHEGYHHDVVIHEEEFTTINEHGQLVHTNSIEGWWGNIKAELKRMRGTSPGMLPGHLDEMMYRQHRGPGDMLEYIVEDIGQYYKPPVSID